MPYHPPIPDSSPDSNRSDDKRPRAANPLASLVEAEKMIQISILLPCSAFVGWLIGAWLDKTLHQTWITLVGILFGGISGIVYVVRMVVAGSNTKRQPPGPGNGGSGSGGASS